MKTNPLLCLSLPCMVVLLVFFGLPVVCVQAQTSMTWNLSSTGVNWSSASAWNPSGSVSGNDVYFASTGVVTSNSSTIGNIVDQNYTINSLTYRNTSAAGMISTQIGTGITLTVDSSATTPPGVIFRIGREETGTLTTTVKISGGGSLIINESTSNIIVNNASNASTAPGYATLDMSGLSTFSANVNSIEIGTKSADGTRGFTRGSVSLAQNSTITASTILVGTSEGANSSGSFFGTGTLQSQLLLGQSNVLNVDGIYIGASSAASTVNRSSGSMQFESGLSGTPTVKIRAKDGVSRATMAIGTSTGYSTVSMSSFVDFSGGSVDALLSTLTIASASNNTQTGSLTMSAGTIDATDVYVGVSAYRTTTYGSTVSGALNVSGGNFIAGNMTLALSTATVASYQAVYGNLSISGTGNVEVTGNLTMGGSGYSGTTYAQQYATIDITGGTLKVDGNIAEGSVGGSYVTSTINLNGGTLDMDGGTITNLTNFNVQSGTLKNLAQYNSGATLVKTGAGTLVIAGTNAYTGTTSVSQGIVKVNGTLSGSAVAVASGATLAGSGSITNGVTVSASGILAPGDGIGTLRTGNLAMQAAAQLSLEISGATAGISYDQLITSGTVNLNSNSGAGADLLITLAYAPATVGQTFTLIDNDGSDAIVGTFGTVNGVAFGADNTFYLNYSGVDYEFKLHYDGEGLAVTGGNDLVLEVVSVPEPSYVAMLAGAVFMLAATVRRRHNNGV